MKTMFKVTLLFALLICANTLFATGNLKVNIIPMKDEKAVVAISALSNTSFKMTLTNNEGHVVYYLENSEQSNNYKKVYNFSDLDDGYYKLTVVSEGMTSERPFRKFRGVIKVGEERTTLKPFFAYEDGRLKFSYLNFPKDDLNLYFYKKNELIYTQNIGREFNISKALNLTKLDRGNYEVVLATKDEVFSYPINIH